MIFKKKNEEDKIKEYRLKIKEEQEKIKQEKKKIKEKKKKEKLDKKKPNLNKNEISKKSQEKRYTTKEAIILSLVSMLIGMLTLSAVILAFLLKNNILSSYKQISRLVEAFTTVESNYYKNVDKDELVSSAISSMYSSIGDTFTTYSSEEQTKDFEESIEGTYEGIGCSIRLNENNEIEVVEVFDDSPSKEAGLKTGDIILKVNGKTFETSTELSNYVKSSTKSKVTLTIKRDEEEKKIEIKRDKIEVQAVTSEVKEINDHKIGYIYISIFSSVSAKQFETNLKKLEKKNIEALIIDVRDNGGGYLTSVTDISNLLLKKGSVIYQLETNNKIKEIKDTTKTKRTYPIAVLINESSASASEILASTIKESYNGIVVGKNSYGKGTVQQTKTLSDGSMIKYTTQKWLTPDGNWINETGVTPTIEVSEDYTTENDEQLDKALEELSNKLN